MNMNRLLDLFVVNSSNLLIYGSKIGVHVMKHTYSVDILNITFSASFIFAVCQINIPFYGLFILF